MRFLADMNISPLTVRILADTGCSVCRVSDVLPANASDSAILAYARRTDSVIITQDMDLSALLALGNHARPSLIQLRLSSADPAAVADRLLRVIPHYETVLNQGCAISVTDKLCRVRLLPIG